MKRVLNVGGNNKETALPPEYRDWTQVLLDIDPRVYVSDLVGRTPGSNRKLSWAIHENIAELSCVPDSGARLVLLLQRSRRVDLRPRRGAMGDDPARTRVHPDPRTA